MEKIREQIKCVEREIGKRIAVYPKWVDAKKMSQEKADKEIQTMSDVLKTLKHVEALFYSLEGE